MMFNVQYYILCSSQKIKTSLMNDATAPNGVCHMTSFTVK